MANASNHSLSISLLTSILWTWLTRSTKTLLPSNLILNLLYIVLNLFLFLLSIFIVFTSFSLFHLLFHKIENKNRGALVSVIPPILLWVPLVQSIGDNACFCCGGRCTLVERNYALIICSVGQIFQNLLLLSIMFYLHCTYPLDLIHFSHHLIVCTS